jgi:hypothetical protein
MSGLALGIGLSGKLDNAYALMQKQEALDAARQAKQQAEEDKKYQAIYNQVKLSPKDYGIFTDKARETVAGFIKNGIQKQQETRSYYQSQANAEDQTKTQAELGLYENQHKNLIKDTQKVYSGKYAWKPEYDKTLHQDPTHQDFFLVHNYDNPYQEGQGLYRDYKDDEIINQTKKDVAAMGGLNNTAEAKSKLAKIVGRGVFQDVEVYDPKLWQQKLSEFYDQNKDDLQYKFPDKADFLERYKENAFEKGQPKGVYVPPGSFNFFGGSGVMANDKFSVVKDPSSNKYLVSSFSDSDRQMLSLKGAVGASDGLEPPEQLTKDNREVSGIIKAVDDKFVYFYVPTEGLSVEVDKDTEVPLNGLRTPMKVYKIPIENVATRAYQQTMDNKGRGFDIFGYKPSKVKSEATKETGAGKAKPATSKPKAY